MISIDTDRFADQVYKALKAAFSEVICANANQSFYAFALFTDNSLQFLHGVANTEEALALTVKHYRETVDLKYGCTSTRARMRWSYGDWGFFPEVGAEHFEEINKVLRANFDDDMEKFETGLKSLWTAILNGFRKLEKERFFGSEPERSKITLLLVGDLPAELVESWVLALNPADVADRFINWNYNEPDCNDPARSTTQLRKPHNSQPDPR
ncbi:MAG TPA: DUF4303 domain-containing protein [Chthoniobacteraceae bacterium]|nr:DUF4303 domain-containing protein [Chthoniobacteraceae bacterium]